jgi:arsenate reductase
MSDATITKFHNPACCTSRNTQALIRNRSIEPAVDAVNAESSRRVAA